MRKAWVGFVISVVAFPGVAHANCPRNANSWEGKLELSLTPRIGASLPFKADDSPVDESEGEISLSAQRKGSSGFTTFRVKGGVSAAPQLLDDSDASSSAFTEVTVGDIYIPFNELRGGPSGCDPITVPDAWRPYARYRFSGNYSEFLEDHSRDDHAVTVGIRYRDVRKIMRSSLEPGADGKIKPVMGWYWEGRVEATQTWSSDPTRERFSPLVRVDLYSRPLARSARFFARTQADLTAYQSALVLDGDKRVDQRIRLTAGVDLSDLLARISPTMTLEIAGQYQRRWSNDPSAEHERAYFIPSFSLSTTF